MLRLGITRYSFYAGSNEVLRRPKSRPISRKVPNRAELLVVGVGIGILVQIRVHRIVVPKGWMRQAPISRPRLHRRKALAGFGPVKPPIPSLCCRNHW